MSNMIRPTSGKELDYAKKGIIFCTFCLFFGTLEEIQLRCAKWIISQPSKIIPHSTRTTQSKIYDVFTRVVGKVYFQTVV